MLSDRKRECEYLKFPQSDYFNKGTFRIAVSSLGKNLRGIQCECVCICEGCTQSVKE